MTTAPATTADTRMPALPTGIFALLGIIDIALLGVVGSSIAPPLAVSIGIAALGAITLAALMPTRRGSQALAVAVTARVISALLAFAAFFAGAPGWVMAIEAFVICATGVALVALRSGARSGSRH